MGSSPISPTNLTTSNRRIDMKITEEHGIFNGVSKDDILNYLNQHPENFDCPVVLYASDDFDDFVATLKDIEVQRNLKDEKHEDKRFDVMWNKFHPHIGMDVPEDEAKSLFVKQCEESLKVKDFIEKLKQIELSDYQITASTETGSIYFLVTDLYYNKVAIPGMFDDTVLMLIGNF